MVGRGLGRLGAMTRGCVSAMIVRRGVARVHGLMVGYCLYGFCLTCQISYMLTTCMRYLLRLMPRESQLEVQASVCHVDCIKCFARLQKMMIMYLAG